ncbi:PAS domain-containing sensor histidine kinase [Hymenobacter aerilatus]|uniref:histidine kinase n=1 Tax=Hymenobacter aerilatus TaxID=2932251 RepID=A0A8T9T1E7_9BACT|nr:PAS domain-containing protein [Hymenobacter aerilatus]UOR05916.1 PAS domain-containing sensor histidine kinase [Hymenobacter aerilatus]
MPSSPDSPTLPISEPESLLDVLLNVSLTGVILFRPIIAADGETILDLAYVHLNPAAQQLLQQPAQPAETFLTLYPNAQPVGVFAFYCAAFRSGRVERHQVLYQHDGLDGYFHLVAQRHGELLVVSFTDTNEHPRTAVEEALRISQAHEQEAYAALEKERNLLQAVLTQSPVAIGLFQGDDCTVVAANDQLCAMWGYAPAEVVGRPLLEGVPELRGQGFTELMREVAATRTPFVGTEEPADLLHHGRVEKHYFNFVYQPIYGPDARVLGVIDIAINVTEQVLARQHVQALNEELRASNEEYLATNMALDQAQQELQFLNEELEARVNQRTQEAQAALRETEYQRERLQVQQRLLQQILGQVPAAIATLNGPEHRYSFFNDQYQQLSAHRTQLGHTVAETFPEVLTQGFIELLDEVYATGRPFIGTEMPALLLNATTSQEEQCYVDFIYQPLFDSKQQIQGILAFVLDVTERVLAHRQVDALQAEMLAVAQRQARERENLYQVFEQTPAVICLLRGAEHRFEYFNPAYQKLFPGRSMRGRTVAETQPEAVAQGFVELLDQVYQTGETFFGHAVPLTIEDVETQELQTIYLNFTYQAYREEDQVVGISVFAYDVTNQVLARQQRDAQQAELQRIFEQAPVAIAILRGSELRVELANTAVGAIWGRLPAQVVGQLYFEAMPETAGQGFEEILAEVLRTGEPYFITEAPVQLARQQLDGQPLTSYVNFVFQPLYNAQRQATGLVAVGIEVTEQVLARQQVLALNSELQTANKTLGQTNQRLARINTDLDTFVYTASHDLKAPIANLEGLLLALREQLPPEALQASLVQRLLDMMDDAVRRFQQTLAHLTDVSQLQPNEATAELVELPALVEAVRLDLAPALAAANATLTVDVAGCPAIHFSSKNLRSIFYNLLSNAIKYHAPDRPATVHLTCHRAADKVIMRVEDNGLGLTEAQQGQLFRMFRRLHTHVPGSGVGLYMVKKIVENAGGTITVKSQPNVGTTFTISLPD